METNKALAILDLIQAVEKAQRVLTGDQILRILKDQINSIEDSIEEKEPQYINGTRN